MSRALRMIPESGNRFSEKCAKQNEQLEFVHE
jgi:hypothetical protein